MTTGNRQQKSAAPPPRKRGRPPRASTATTENGNVLTREQILEKATELAKAEPLDDISMVGLAREFGVAPGLIHYYVGSHGDLISAVANRFFRARLENVQPLTGDWEKDLWQEAVHSFRLSVEYGGVGRYMMLHNRFRLFQQVREGETDYGMQYLKRLVGIFRSGGFTLQQAAIGFHLLQLYVTSSAHAEVSRQLPAFHARYIRGQVESHGAAEEMKQARYFLDAFASVDSATAFPAGLKLLIDGFRGWLAARDKAAVVPARRRKGTAR